MISSAGTTVVSVSAWYGAAVCLARSMVASGPCSPSTPSDAVMGFP